MVVSSHSLAMTVEAYLAWEPSQELRYEYVNGEVVAMTGGTLPHNDIDSIGVACPIEQIYEGVVLPLV